jgi:type IV secretory pathway VirB4 component
LPHGQCELAGILLDSRSASTLFPFLSNTLYHPHGVLEGVTPQGDPVLLDPWGEGMANANRLILGPPGWGKSHGIKTTLIRHLLKVACNHHLKRQIIVIDPDSEYSHMCDLFGGQTIRLAPGSAQRINPFDLPKRREGDVRAGHEDRLAEHVHKMHTLLEIMLADRTPSGAKELTAKEHSLLDQAILEIYRQMGITNDIVTHDRPAPLMRDLYHFLETKKEEQSTFDPTGLKERLRRYVNGSLKGLFDGPTNISLDRMMIDFDIQGLETELRPIGLFLITNFVWTESYHSKIPRILVVDEAATLMEYESGKKFLEDLVRRIRKQYGGVWVISQHPLIFLDTSIPANCATHVLMRQDATTLDLIERMFKLSSREIHLLRRLPIGEALLLTGEKRLHIRFEASEVEHLLATTKQEEIAAWREHYGNDEAFDQLLHRLGLDSPDPEEKQITAPLPALNVGQEPGVSNGYQLEEV